jgi:predicted Zn-dependent peptidase
MARTAPRSTTTTTRRRAQPAAVRVSRLRNGARVVSEVVPGARSVSIGCYVGVGTRDEPERIVGASHFLEHLLFKGTTTRSARDIAEAVDATGGEMNAYTTKEYTAFYLRVPAMQLDESLALLADVVTRPAFRPAEVESERQVILEELHLQLDEPDDLAHTMLYEAMFPGHPLGWEIVGHEGSIASMTPAALRRFHRRWYVPANFVFAVAGPVDHDHLVALVRRALRGVGEGARPARRAPRRPPVERRIVRRRGESEHVVLGWPSLHLGHPDRYSLALANQIIGAGMSSRLFQSVREERGLAYSVFSSAAGYSDAGVFSVYAGTTPSRSAELISVLRGELDRLALDGVTEHELALAKRSFEGSTIVGLEDTGARMARLGIGLTVRDEIVDLDDYLDALRAASTADVHRVLSTVLSSAPTLCAVGPAPVRSLVW